MPNTQILPVYKVSPDGTPSYEPIPGAKTIPIGAEVSSVAKAEKAAESQVGRETPTNLGAILTSSENLGDIWADNKQLATMGWMDGDIE
jgi:hypothetical protein